MKEYLIILSISLLILMAEFYSDKIKTRKYTYTYKVKVLFSDNTEKEFSNTVVLNKSGFRLYFINRSKSINKQSFSLVLGKKYALNIFGSKYLIADNIKGYKIINFEETFKPY